MRFLRALVALALFLAVAPAYALEGKWTPQQVLELDPAWLKSIGLEVAPSRLWDPARGTGLLAATINIPGCSAAFVSPAGLIVTNHHCAFSLVQEHSTAERDLIANGFLARTRDEELPGKTFRAAVPRRFTDVTAQIEKAVPKNADDLARAKAIDAKEKELVERCEKTPAARCRVAAFDGGLFYTLIESFEIRDVRLVYAPPLAVGEFGGEIDNWTWPRHTGDFAILRAWVAPDGTSSDFASSNVPYAPEFYFPVPGRDLDPGDFVMVLGYPGTTYRALLAEEMRERRELWFPKREELFGEWIEILERHRDASDAARIALASKLKTLHNRYKNAQGQIAGLDRGGILAQQREADERVAAWAADKPAYRRSLAARDELRTVLARRLATWERDFLLENLASGSVALDLAQKVVHTARERQKADRERTEDSMERNLARRRATIERAQKDYVEPADKELFATFVRRALALPADQRIAAVDALFGAGASEAEIRRKIDELYANTAVTDRARRMAMFDETPAQLRASKDPLIELAFAVDDAVRARELESERRSGAISRLRPAWRRAVIAHAGKPVAPDANSTLRVSFARVQGYEPRDAVVYTPQTTLEGIVEKHTDADPFDVPERILAKAADAEASRWADPDLGDVSVAFLADADTTGGNSGSPVVNGRGELVGVNFDRVWENVANDFGFNPDIARNISVDIRYMLWILDEIEGAERLLEELGAR